jgi:hypothetical protein
MTGRHVKPRPRRDTETSAYVAMLIRIIYGFGKRVGDDPAALVHLREIEAALRDATNVGIFAANKIGQRPYSINEMAGILEISKQAIHTRVKAGAETFAELEAARAAGPLVRLGDVRDRRALALEQAGVEDKTGSPRELAAGQ